MLWIPPDEFRISKIPLSILLVPELTIRLPLEVSRGLTVLVSPGGTFTTPAANRILRSACAADRSLGRARGRNAKSVTWAVHEIPTPLHVSGTRHREPLHDGGPSSRSRTRAGVTGPTAALATANPGEGPPLDYPGHFEVRYVRFYGGIRWKRDWVNVSIMCAGEYVGLEEIDTVSGTSTLALSNSVACSKTTCRSKMPTESSSAEIQSPLKATSARRSHSHLEGPVDMWTTSLLPTYSQPCNLSRSTKSQKEVLESI
jgi:hypothetical protein